MEKSTAYHVRASRQTMEGQHVLTLVTQRKPESVGKESVRAGLAEQGTPRLLNALPPPEIPVRRTNALTPSCGTSPLPSPGLLYHLCTAS